MYKVQTTLLAPWAGSSYIYIYTHTHIHAYMHTMHTWRQRYCGSMGCRLTIYIYIYIYICMYILYVYIHTYIQCILDSDNIAVRSMGWRLTKNTCIYIYIHVHICTHTYIYIYIYVHIHTCIQRILDAGKRCSRVHGLETHKEWSLVGIYIHIYLHVYIHRTHNRCRQTMFSGPWAGDSQRMKFSMYIYIYTYMHTYIQRIIDAGKRCSRVHGLETHEEWSWGFGCGRAQGNDVCMHVYICMHMCGYVHIRRTKWVL
jgi:hypothetical protein